jgi:taurine dioxygenase
MTSAFRLSTPLPGANFGGTMALTGDGGAHSFVRAAQKDPGALPRMLAESSGLLLIQGMDAMAEQPELLVRFSRIFGPEVEDYRDNLTPLNMVHDTVPEILVVSNTPPVSRQPPRLPIRR